MSPWIERIVKEFPADLSHLWIVVDPDDILLNEQVLAVLRERGFDVLLFDDSVTFRVEYEERYRIAWDNGNPGSAVALILHLRGIDVNNLPWDYLKQARKVNLSLADLFPKLSYSVIRQLGTEYLGQLFEAQDKHASQSLGDAATKEFVLTHIFRVVPHLISRSDELWRELLQLHYRDASLPLVLAEYVSKVLKEQGLFLNLNITELFSSKNALLRRIQGAWYRYITDAGMDAILPKDEILADYSVDEIVPFSHPNIRAIIDSMFMEGALQPIAVKGMLENIPEWMKIGIIEDPAAMRNLISDGIKSLMKILPNQASSYRDWAQFARRVGGLIARFHSLDIIHSLEIKDSFSEFQRSVDDRLQEWVKQHYSDLPSLPIANGPVMVHHVPRFLSSRRSSGEDKIALLVFDGLAVDQWVRIRERLIKKTSTLEFDESACFAWLPTLTSVSRQALFSGLRPREFSESIETTARESAQWLSFWKDHGLRQNEVFYRKGIKRTDQLAELSSELGNPAIKIAGLVIDTVDEIIHGAVLGKRGVANQIDNWCETRFVDILFNLLLDNGFHIYLTADHGNVDALGIGRPSEGVASELRGERVRIYRSEALASDSETSNPGSYRMTMPGLPSNFIPLFSGDKTAFVVKEDQVVVHGGISVEELIVPFVKIKRI